MGRSVGLSLCRSGSGAGMAKYYQILPNAGNFEIGQIDFRLNLPLWRVKKSRVRTPSNSSDTDSSPEDIDIDDDA